MKPIEPTPLRVQAFDLDLPDVWQNMLTTALVGPDREQLYRTSAAFHHSVDQLVALLPLWIDAIAWAAGPADQQAEMARQMMAQATADAEATIPDLMADLDASLTAAKAARDRHVQHDKNLCRRRHEGVDPVDPRWPIGCPPHCTCICHVEGAPPDA